jgi:hypothetical protein
MEFEPEQQTSSDIDEATRLAASTRVLTLAPVHDDITPEDEPEELVANQHIIQPPIANIPTDAEVTLASNTALAHEQANHHLALAASIAIMLIVGSVTVVSFLSR